MSLSTVILALHFRLGCWYLLCQHQVLQKFERKKQSLELVLHLQPAPFPWASSLGFLQLFEKEAQDWLWCQSHQILCHGYDGPCDETCVGASLARIWIWFAIAALLGTATFFLGTKRKLQMEILFFVLPSHMGAGEDCLQKGLAAGGCSGKYPCALSLIPAGLLGLLLLEQSLELS